VGEASSPARIPVGNTPSLNLGRVAEMGAPMVSIGGAGTFAVPVLLPPLLAADVALVLAFRQAPPVAYIAGTMGALMGQTSCDASALGPPGPSLIHHQRDHGGSYRAPAAVSPSPPAWNHALCQAVLGVSVCVRRCRRVSKPCVWSRSKIAGLDRERTRGNPVRFPFSQGIPRSIPTQFPCGEVSGVRGDAARQSDDIRLEGEASRFRWLRAPATTDIDPQDKDKTPVQTLPRHREVDLWITAPQVMRW
jgi:hypothetical protein